MPGVQDADLLEILHRGQAGFDGFGEPLGGARLLGAVDVEQGAVGPGPGLLRHQGGPAVGEALVRPGHEAGAQASGLDGQGPFQARHGGAGGIEQFRGVEPVLAADGDDHGGPGRFVGGGDVLQVELVPVAVVHHGGGDAVVDVGHPGHAVGGQLRGAAQPGGQFLAPGVEEAGEGVDGVVQPVGERLVLGDADQGLLVVMAVGLDEGGDQQHVLHGDRVRGRDLPPGMQDLHPVAPGCQQPPAGFRAVRAGFQDVFALGQHVAVVDSLGAVRRCQGQHEPGPADQ